MGNKDIGGHGEDDGFRRFFSLETANGLHGLFCDVIEIVESDAEDFGRGEGVGLGKTLDGEFDGWMHKGCWVCG